MGNFFKEIFFLLQKSQCSITCEINDQEMSQSYIHVQTPQYIEDIQVFGVNMTFISLSEVKNFYIS